VHQRRPAIAKTRVESVIRIQERQPEEYSVQG